MNADAEFIKLLKDEADYLNYIIQEPSIYLYREILAAEANIKLCLKLLKSLGITYTPNSRKDRE